MPAEVTASPPTFMTLTIMPGTAITDAHRVSGKVVGIILPAGWDAAALSFQAGPYSTNMGDVYDAGVERTIASAQAVSGRMIALSLNDWLCANVLRIRSGTSAAPVNQTARRDITVVLAG